MEAPARRAGSVTQQRLSLGGKAVEYTATPAADGNVGRGCIRASVRGARA